MSPRTVEQRINPAPEQHNEGREFEIALAFRYLQPDFQTTWRLIRNSNALLLDALADNVTLTTVVAEDGQLIARAHPSSLTHTTQRP